MSITGYEKPVILLNVNLFRQFATEPFTSNKYHESIIVHELAHFLQVNHIDKTEKEAYPNPSNDNPQYYDHKLEREAYFVQAMCYYDEHLAFNPENLPRLANRFFEEHKITSYRYSSESGIN